MNKSFMFKLFFNALGDIQLATKENTQQISQITEELQALRDQAIKVEAEVAALKAADEAKRNEIDALRAINATAQENIDALNAQLANSGIGATDDFALGLTALNQAFTAAKEVIQRIDDINVDPVVEVPVEVPAIVEMPVEALPVEVTQDAFSADPADVSAAVVEATE